MTQTTYNGVDIVRMFMDIGNAVQNSPTKVVSFKKENLSIENRVKNLEEIVSSIQDKLDGLTG